MSVGGNPGLTQRVKVTRITPTFVAFINDEFEISVAGPKEYLKDYKVGDWYVVHIRRAGDGQSDAGNPASSSS